MDSIEKIFQGRVVSSPRMGHQLSDFSLLDPWNHNLIMNNYNPFYHNCVSEGKYKSPSHFLNLGSANTSIKSKMAQEKNTMFGQNNEIENFSCNMDSLKGEQSEKQENSELKDFETTSGNDSQDSCSFISDIEWENTCLMNSAAQPLPECDQRKLKFVDNPVDIPTGVISRYFITQSQNTEINFAMKLDFQENQLKKIYKCRYCDLIFDKSCSLGGHISRIHRQETREQKEKGKKAFKLKDKISLPSKASKTMPSSIHIR